MKNLVKELLNDDLSHVASSRRFVLLTSSITLCLGFIICVVAILCGYDVSSELILGLAAIISTLAGTTYTTTKLKEIKNNHEEHSVGNQ